VLDGCLGIEPIEAVIAVAFALAKVIVWYGVIIWPESLTMGHSPSVTQGKFRHPLAQVNSKVHHINVCAEPVGQARDVVGDECNLEHIPLSDFSLYISIPHPSQSQSTLDNHQSTHLPLPLLFVPVSGQLMAVLLL